MLARGPVEASTEFTSMVVLEWHKWKLKPKREEDFYGISLESPLVSNRRPNFHTAEQCPLPLQYWQAQNVSDAA